jgi:ABC-type sulfate transport system substrate-binding protein
MKIAFVGKGGSGKDRTRQDWDRFQRDAVQFHLRNAKAWGNARAGRDLADQIDPEFTLERKNRYVP